VTIGGKQHMKKLGIALIGVLTVLTFLAIAIAGIKENENIVLGQEIEALKQEKETLEQQVAELQYWTEGYFKNRIIELEKATVHAIYDSIYDSDKGETKLTWLAIIQSTHTTTIQLKVGFLFANGEELGQTWYQVEAGITRWVSGEGSVSGETEVEGVSVEILAPG
jgi:hypothetical protein